MDSDTIQLAYIMQEQLKHYSKYCKFSNPNIIGVYGSFNNIIWNGGRAITTSEFTTFDSIKNCIKDFNNHNLICKFTFTNQLLTQEHCYDSYCNQILDLIAETNNEIVIHSPILEQYIRNIYPNIPLTSSITKGFDFNTFKIALHQDYKNVVCHYKQNILKYLETMPIELQNKTELILNADACAYCKMFTKHYECESYYNLYGKYLNQNNCYKFYPDYDAQKEWFNLSIEERLIFDIQYFNWLNIHNYKIQGRTKNIGQLIDIYLSIFFYSEIHEEIYNNIKNSL